MQPSTEIGFQKSSDAFKPLGIPDKISFQTPHDMRFYLWSLLRDVFNADLRRMIVTPKT